MKRLTVCLVLVSVLGCGDRESGPPAMDIFQAAGEGNLQAVKQHIAAGTDLDQRTLDGQESTPLIVAVSFGRLDTVEALIAAKANLDLQNKDGNTALSIAAFLCHTEIVQVLLKNGAELNTRNKLGATALDAVQAPWNDLEPIYDLLDRNIYQPAKMPLDYERIKATRPQVAQLLSQSGGQSSALAGNPGVSKPQDTAGPALRTWKDVSGNFSVEAAFVRIADDKVILQHADKTEVSVPLSVLSAADRQYVQERPAAAPQVDIFLAAVVGNLQAVKQHIATGTDLNQRTPDAEKKTPLMLASLFGRTESARALIEAGADLDLQDKDGGTALSAAAFMCHTEIVQALLKKGANRNVKNKDGFTALQSVEGPFEDVKFIYDIIDGLVFKPAGMPLDYERIKTMRPRVAQLLR